MNRHRPIVKDIFISLFFLTALSLGFSASAQDGKTLFQNNCSTCHNPVNDGVGPALKGVTSRVTDKTLLHAWIHNNAAVLASGNPYFTGLYKSRGGAAMNIFTQLSDKDIDAILAYVESYVPPTAGPKDRKSVV